MATVMKKNLFEVAPILGKRQRGNMGFEEEWCTEAQYHHKKRAITEAEWELPVDTVNSERTTICPYWHASKNGNPEPRVINIPAFPTRQKDGTISRVTPQAIIFPLCTRVPTRQECPAMTEQARQFIKGCFGDAVMEDAEVQAHGAAPGPIAADDPMDSKAEMPIYITESWEVTMEESGVQAHGAALGDTDAEDTMDARPELTVLIAKSTEAVMEDSEAGTAAQQSEQIDMADDDMPAQGAAGMDTDDDGLVLPDFAALAVSSLADESDETPVDATNPAVEMQAQRAALTGSSDVDIGAHGATQDVTERDGSGRWSDEIDALITEVMATMPAEPPACMTAQWGGSTDAATNGTLNFDSDAIFAAFAELDLSRPASCAPVQSIERDEDDEKGEEDYREPEGYIAEDDEDDEDASAIAEKIAADIAKKEAFIEVLRRQMADDRRRGDAKKKDKKLRENMSAKGNGSKVKKKQTFKSTNKRGKAKKRADPEPEESDSDDLDEDIVKAVRNLAATLDEG